MIYHMAPFAQNIQNEQLHRNGGVVTWGRWEIGSDLGSWGVTAEGVCFGGDENDFA